MSSKYLQAITVYMAIYATYKTVYHVILLSYHDQHNWHMNIHEISFSIS